MHRLCGHRLGMENGNISDSRITASSTYNGCQTSYGRLHNKVTSYSGYSAWCADTNDTQAPWFQVDLTTQMQVEGVIMQGSYLDNHDEWVTAYQVDYSDDETTWQYVGGTSSVTAQVRFIIGQIMTDHTAHFQHFIRVMPLMQLLVQGKVQHW